MTKRDFQTLEYIAEATEQQTSQVGDGPDCPAMNPDVQSAALHKDSIFVLIDKLIADRKRIWESMANSDEFGDVMHASFALGGKAALALLKHELASLYAKQAQVEHEAKRDAAD